MPPLPIYMLSGSSIALFVISGCILLARRLATHAIVRALALTFYVAHVVIGMGVVEEFGTAELGTYSLQFSVVYGLIFSAACVLFAVIWTRYRSSGPLEWLMHKVVH